MLDGYFELVCAVRVLVFSVLRTCQTPFLFLSISHDCVWRVIHSGRPPQFWPSPHCKRTLMMRLPACLPACLKNHAKKRARSASAAKQRAVRQYFWGANSSFPSLRTCLSQFGFPFHVIQLAESRVGRPQRGRLVGLQLLHQPFCPLSHLTHCCYVSVSPWYYQLFRSPARPVNRLTGDRPDSTYRSQTAASGSRAESI